MFFLCGVGFFYLALSSMFLFNLFTGTFSCIQLFNMQDYQGFVLAFLSYEIPSIYTASLFVYILVTLTYSILLTPHPIFVALSNF